MWNRRDWAVLGAAAFGAFGLTLAVFWASPLQAGDARPLTESIQTPTYDVGSCKITASVVDNKQIEGARNNVVFLHEGSVPDVQLMIKNTSESAAGDAPIHIEMRSASAVRLSRTLMFRPPVFSKDYNLALEPGETKTLDIPFDKVVTAKGDSLTLVISRQQITAAAPVTGNRIPAINSAIRSRQAADSGAVQLLRMAVQPLAETPAAPAHASKTTQTAAVSEAISR